MEASMCYFIPLTEGKLTALSVGVQGSAWGWPGFIKASQNSPYKEKIHLAEGCGAIKIRSTEKSVTQKRWPPNFHDR